MSMIETVAKMLLQGATAETAIDALRDVYKTEGSLSSQMSRVRSYILDRNVRPPEYDDSALRALSANPEIKRFISLPLRDQHKIQREHRTRASWGPQAEQALSQLKLLPKNMDGFALTKEETLSLKRQREESLVAKNDALRGRRVCGACAEGRSSPITTASCSPRMSIDRAIELFKDWFCDTRPIHKTGINGNANCMAKTLPLFQKFVQAYPDFWESEFGYIPKGKPGQKSIT